MTESTLLQHTKLLSKKEKKIIEISYDACGTKISDALFNKILTLECRRQEFRTFSCLIQMTDTDAYVCLRY